MGRKWEGVGGLVNEVVCVREREWVGLLGKVWEREEREKKKKKEKKKDNIK